MSFVVSGLSAEPFLPLFGLSDAELETRDVVRKRVDAKPGYPCRVTLQDAEAGESVLLLNYESHAVDTPYRSRFAIYVREHQTETARAVDVLPPVMIGRPIALRLFDDVGMLVGADMGAGEVLVEKIRHALERPDVAYIHAHNAMHGCFVADVRRAG